MRQDQLVELAEPEQLELMEQMEEQVELEHKDLKVERVVPVELED